ncbi:MAG TPA: hypothetical protein VFP25_05150 [Nitrososphaeraceae archaeon]|nr:hypothetical protein [Nitrososphaeraceae archaeon]
MGRVVEETKEGKLIQIENETFERMKGNSVRYGEVESVDEIMNRLLDFMIVRENH